VSLLPKRLAPGCRNWGWNHSPSRAGIRLRFSDSVEATAKGEEAGGWVGKGKGLQVTRKNLYFLSAEEKFGKNFSAQGADKDFTGVEENFHVLKRPLSVYGLAEG